MGVEPSLGPDADVPGGHVVKPNALCAKLTLDSVLRPLMCQRNDCVAMLLKLLCSPIHWLLRNIVCLILRCDLIITRNDQIMTAHRGNDFICCLFDCCARRARALRLWLCPHPRPQKSLASTAQYPFANFVGNSSGPFKGESHRTRIDFEFPCGCFYLI